jgi:energy-coupling factor transporter transmembrane protein EcfT
MGFGFNLFFALFLLPLTVILLVIWALTRRAFFGKALGIIWLSIFALILFSVATRPLSEKKVLTQEDYYGEYIIDRSYFPGKQADWQYNNFHFIINPDNSIYFYSTPKNEPAKVYKGYISTSAPYASARLIVHMPAPTHHILTTDPTVYRKVWSFFLVFNSPKFGNMYFKKGKWEPR